jgi:hypothetical protein
MFFLFWHCPEFPDSRCKLLVHVLMMAGTLLPDF